MTNYLSLCACALKCSHWGVVPVVSLRAKLTSFLSLTSITSKILMARTQVAVFIAILVILSAFSPEVTACSQL